MLILNCFVFNSKKSDADVFQLNVDASGVVPQLSVIMGPCAGKFILLLALNSCSLID